MWLMSFEILDNWPSSHTSAIGYLANRDIQREFPANMPWPMTLAHMNEAISREF
jgi:hypothetical protein